MGYYINQREAMFRIKKENFDAALKAVVELADEKHRSRMNGGSWKCGKRTSWNYAWVNMEELKNAKTLEDAMNCWGWEVYTEDEDIVDICFVSEKLGQEEVLFDAIAPFVEDGSYIEMGGEDGGIWRWQFNKGICVENEANISFDAF